jgi:hypothetical protein
MNLWVETSLSELYLNTVKAFPNTIKRQYSIDEVKIEHIDWVPFRGMGTLFVKGLARREGSKNECVILFKGVKYSKSAQKGFVEITASNGERVFLERLSVESTDVAVRCTCKDFYWRMVHFNKIDGSLYGRDRKKYEALYNPGSSNPMEMAGICKHLIKMSKALSEARLLR